MDSNQPRQVILKLRFMSSLPLDLRDKVADVFVKISEQRSVPAGGVFIHEHENVDDRGFILLSGKILVRKSEAPDATCDAPEILGEIQQFNPAHKRTATLSGAVPCVVMVFKWSDLWNTLNQELLPGQIEEIRKALEMHAWELFMR